MRAKEISDAAYSAVSNAVSSLGWSIIPAGLRVGSVAVPVAMVIGIAAVVAIAVVVYRSIGTAVVAIAVVVAGIVVTVVPVQPDLPRRRFSLVGKRWGKLA